MQYSFETFDYSEVPYSTTKGTMTTTGSMWMIDTKTNQTTTSDNTSITISQVSNGAKTYAGITNTTS